MKNGQRVIGITLLGMIILAGCMLASVAYGSNLIPIGQVLQALQNPDSGTFEASVVWARIPRTVFGVLAGAALGVSGALMQAVTRNPIADPSVLGVNTGASLFGVSGNTFQTLLRNPLASPDIIGVTSGASAAAVFCILMLKWSGGIVSLVAVLAGLFVAALIYLLARDRHGCSGSRMILIGIGMQAMLNALISWMLLKGSEYDVATALRWLRGSLNGVQMSDVPVLSITVLVGGFILIVLNRSLQVMQLGEEYPITLGAPVQRVRLGSILCALLLTAVATSITGPIASVAFLSGPIASRIVGKGRTNLLASALVGVVLILASELVGQNLFAVRYPVGVITGILGAPYLLLLLLQINKKGERV